MLQLIDIDGRFKGGRELKPARRRCLEMFRYLLFLRTFDEQVLSLQRAGRLAFCNPNTGEEACQIGSAFALSPQDWVFPSYRVAGVYLYRKRSPLPLLHQLFGNASDLSRGTQLPMHFGDKEARFVSVSSPIGTQITQAVGLSYAAKLRREPVLAVAYFGDGATSANDFHAGLNFAGVFGTPTLFFCVNNQYALSVPVDRQTASQSIAAKGPAYGVRSLQVDGTDALAVYQATRDAADHARSGKGPVLIEAVCYRLGLHSSSDDPALYRTSEEEESWRQKDPIPLFRRFLQREGWWSREWEEEAQAGNLSQIEEAIREAEGVGPAEKSSLFENVYSKPTPGILAQRSLAASFDESGRNSGS